MKIGVAKAARSYWLISGQKGQSGGRIGALPPTRVHAKPYQDCDVYYLQNLKGFSRSLYLPVQSLKKMACHLMAVFHLPEFRNLFPANLLCIRASGVEWTARRRVLRTWDVSAQHYPASFAFRIRNRYG